MPNHRLPSQVGLRYGRLVVLKELRVAFKARKNVNGNYTPKNCTWIDNRDQARNRTNHHILNYNGESLSVTEWGRKLGIKYTTIQSRLRYGFPIERVLTP